MPARGHTCGDPRTLGQRQSQGRGVLAGAFRIHAPEELPGDMQPEAVARGHLFQHHVPVVRILLQGSHDRGQAEIILCFRNFFGSDRREKRRPERMFGNMPRDFGLGLLAVKGLGRRRARGAQHTVTGGKRYPKISRTHGMLLFRPAVNSLYGA